MQTLIIYDSTGMIWNITYGQYALPEGLTAIIMDVPEGSQVQSIDVSGETPKLVFASLPENDIQAMKAEMNTLRAENTFMSTALTFAAETFTDEQALKVPTLYDEWFFDSINNKGVDYKTGKRIRFNGVLYKVLQDHISQESWTPDVATSLFAKVLVEDPNAIVEWEQPSSTNGYMTGNKVTHNGVVYESLVDNNVWEPGATGSESLWKVVE